MKRQIITACMCIIVIAQLQAQFKLSGKIMDEQEQALEGASVALKHTSIGTISNTGGAFEIKNIPGGDYTLVVSYIGYVDHIMSISIWEDTDVAAVLMQEISYQGEEVTISALKAGEKTPMAFTNLTEEEITARNFGQDIPYLLGSTPSLITSSDAGHGIGYTAMRIRGTDANRINVTINGIPLNDAESHSVFWVDLPELASSTEQIQIQRGVGTSTNGAAAFGATVNMQTKLLNKEPYAQYDMTAGSFKTFRNSISAGTGLIKDKFAIDLRLSDLRSDGYIDRSWTDLQSYYLSAAYYSEQSSLKFITFGGFEELYQSWGGVPSSLLETNRTYNEMGLYTDSSGVEHAYDKQVDHYDQIHYQLHYSKTLSDALYFNAALHYTRGNGYYEQYESDDDYEFYSMIPPIIEGDTLTQTDLVRRKWLDNDFYGAIASLKYEANKSTAILGGGWNRYYGLHFGKVIWAQYFGENASGHKWYEGSGDKTDLNVYGKYYYYFNDRITTFLDLQMRRVTHIIEGTDANNRDVTQDHEFLFFNPKAGINFEPIDGHRAFFSFARANREPNRNNYTDAPAERQPVQETLHDFEAGYSLSTGKMYAGLTLYFMDYKDQLVLTGQINEVGYPVMTNIENSYRAGTEIEFRIKPVRQLDWNMNLTLSRNQIESFTNYIDNWSYWDDPDLEPYQIEEEIGKSTLAFSPSIIASSQLTYTPFEELRISLASKYVGKQYVDNTANENFKLDPYFVNDLRISYSIRPNWVEEIKLSMLLVNLLNERYETNAWLYRYYYGGSEYSLDGYYPQAGRHVMFGVGISF